ncbi:ribose ABC transporter permease [Spirochaetia bacterium]|nr:ribose ABC transporter permease [Spirochaetia bacterium]
MYPVSKALKQHWFLLIMVVLFFTVGVLVPNFLTLRNLLNVVRQSSIISLVAYGMTMVIIVKGIDLAVGGMMSCCAMISGLLMLQNWPVVLAVGVGLLVGIVMGAFNGMMVQKLEVPAFITTLVVGQVAGGIALVLNNGRSIGGFPAGYVFIGNGSFLGIPISNYITLVFVVFCTILMARTRIGIYIYALGGNDMVVKQQGISSARINYFVFAFSGFCAAVAGILLSAQLDTVHPTQGSNYQLDAVAACVIGGVNMAGGEGKIYMSLAGALIIGFLRNALNLLGMHPFYQNIIVGVIIILIVAVSINGRQRELERGRVF